MAKKKAKKKISKKKISKKKKIVATPPSEQKGVGPIMTRQGSHEHDYQDDHRTSRKRRRSSTKVFEGAGREEQRQVESMDMLAHLNESAKIRPPRRSARQNRSH